MKNKQVRDSIDDMEAIYQAMTDYYDNDNINNINDDDIETLAKIDKQTRKASRKWKTSNKHERSIIQSWKQKDKKQWIKVAYTSTGNIGNYRMDKSLLE